MNAEETQLSKNIKIADRDPRLDAACRKVLANKTILSYIMKECLEEYKDCTVEEIENEYIEGTPEIGKIAVNPDETAENIKGISNEDVTINEGTIVYDIRYEAKAPKLDGYIQLIINIEAQNNYNPGYPLIKRALYYAARMISSQYGTEFKKSQYDKIKKVYSIWICTDPPKEKRNTVSKYKITEENVIGKGTEQKEYYDLMSVIMLRMGNEESENNKGIIKMLNVLLSKDKKASEKKEILSEDFKMKMNETLNKEVNHMCDISRGIIKEARMEGMQLGIQQGMQQGIQQGKIQTMLKMINLLNIPEDKAFEAAGVTKAEYENYLKSISEQ